MSGGHAVLARSTAWGAVWTLVATGGARIVTLAGLAALARLLAPEDFGLLAFAFVFITYIETVGDLGTGAALIYWPDRRDDAARVTFWINVVMGGVWFTAMTLLAPAIAAFFRNPEGEPILRALAWSFPIKALGNTHDALLQRELRFRARIVPELGQAAVKAAVSVPLALAGFGVWSLVWGQLAGLALWTVLLWAALPWRPRLGLPPGMLRPMLRYGRGIAAVNAIAAAVHHVDLVIVGRMLGAAALGYYQLAYKIPEMTVILLVRVASRVLFPAFSRLHAAGGEPELRAGYLTALRYVALLALPAAVGLILLAGPIVRAVFGDGWEPSIPILRALAAYMGLRALGTNAGDILKATARPGLLAGLGVGKAAVLIPALYVAGRHGATAVAVTLAGVTAGLTAVNLAVACRLTGLGAAALARALRPAVVGSAVMAPVLAAWLATAARHLPAVALPGGVLLGAIVYLAVVHVHNPDVLRHAGSSLARARPARPVAERIPETAG